MIGTGVFIVPRHVLGGKDFTAPSDQLGLAAIGSGGKGTSDISNAYQNGKNRVLHFVMSIPQGQKRIHYSR